MNQEREQIARIIHPWPFSDEVVNASRTSIDFHTGAEYRIAALAKADAIFALRSGGEGWRPTHRHVKRGTEYEVLGTARVQSARPLEDMEAVIVYQDREGVAWVRPPSEFNDGRFEPLPASPSTHGEG